MPIQPSRWNAPLFCWAALLACAFVNRANAVEANAIDLLRLPAAKLERASVEPAERGGLAALYDGDTGTAGTARVAAATPLELVYGFGGATVAPERLSVRLPSNPAAGAARVELLVSMVSPHAGFQLVRADPLKARAEAQEFKFAPTAARWVMLRFVPADKVESLAIAEVSLLGHEGQPKSQYAFKQSPAAAMEVLGKLKALSSLDVKISDDEAALFADVKDGQFHSRSFEEAALIASGVGEGQKRKAYLDRIDTLHAGAVKATAGAASAFDKGERLLKWLHAEALGGGYESQQTSLAVVLDSGKYNCVSSTVLYNILARRLGLDARAVEVPDHAFAVVYNGTEHADVETTTDAGYNPARDPASRQKLREMTGLVYLPDSHRDQRREVREAGLVAVIYYNRGVALTEAKRHHEALLCYFRAMSLDAEFASAIKNALASLANWAIELAQAGRFEQGLEVLTVGLQLAPHDATLLHNRKVFWGQWAEALAAKGLDGEAVEVLEKAAAAVPDESAHFRAQQPWVYIRAGEACADAGKWQGALAATGPGLKRLKGDALTELHRWRRDVHLRWSHSLLDAKDFAGAARVLQEGRAAEPDDARYAKAMLYTLQEWARETYTSQGEQKARELLQAELKGVKDVKGGGELAASHVQWVAQQLLEAGKPEECIAAIDRHADLLPAPEVLRKVMLPAVDALARQRREANDAAGAIKVYEDALKRWPKDRHLANNLVFTVQEAVKEIHANGGETKAGEFLKAVLGRFPKITGVREVAEAHVHCLAEALTEGGKYEEALAMVEKHAALLGEKSARECSVRVYDAWARPLVEQKRWKAAVDVYLTGLKRFPGDRHLRKNGAVVCNNWAGTLIEEKKWDEAIRVYEQGLEWFGADSTLKNNLEYCKQERAGK